jgi:hypothetical protein
MTPSRLCCIVVVQFLLVHVQLVDAIGRNGADSEWCICPRLTIAEHVCIRGGQTYKSKW